MYLVRIFAAACSHLVQKSFEVGPNIPEGNIVSKSVGPLLLVHIGAGALGMFSGAVSMTAPKGTRLHARAGNIYVAAIVTMGVTGASVAVTRWLDSRHAFQIGNFLMGLFTSYLALTGWLAGRRRVKGVSWKDRASLAMGMLIAGLFAAAAAGTAAGVIWLQHGLPAAFFAVVGSVAVLAVAGDIRSIARGGILGVVRLRRHLWRMCTAMLITVLSFFIGQAQVLPVWLVSTHINSLPVMLTAIYLIFWFVKLRVRKAGVLTSGSPVVTG